jgi:hypothetical protein
MGASGGLTFLGGIFGTRELKAQMCKTVNVEGKNLGLVWQQSISKTKVLQNHSILCTPC